MAKDPPDRLWVLLRHRETGTVYHAGWAKATEKGYIFEDPPAPPPEHLSNYKFERQPFRQVGRIW